MDNRLKTWTKLFVFLATAAVTILVLLVTLPEIIDGALQRHPRICAVLSASTKAVWEFRGHLRTWVISGRTESFVSDYISRHAVRKLQLGAGPNHLPGWLNTDVEPRPGQAFLDATRPFPIPDGSFHYVASEHVFEHLSYEEGRAMLAECYRILRPGGKVRIATVNLLKFVSLFQEKKTDEALRYIVAVRGYIEEKRGWQEWPLLHSPECTILNLQFNSFGHKFLYDPETLRSVLGETGFQRVREFEPGQSDDPALRGVESRDAGAMREPSAFETMVMEAVRP